MKTTIYTRIIFSVLFFLFVMFSQCTFVGAQPDSIRYPRIENPRYFGYEIGAVVKFQMLTSSIPQLQRLQVIYEGAYAGVKMANQRGGLRANAGLYYSSGSVPYTIEMVSGGMAGNLYLLRLREVTHHTLEPYALFSITYYQAKFSGTYMNDDIKNNRSISDEPELGRLNWCTAAAGAGVEFQVENDKHQFMHFFAEAKYGIPVYTRGSNKVFSRTQVTTPITVTVGMSFGKFK